MEKLSMVLVATLQREDAKKLSDLLNSKGINCYLSSFDEKLGEDVCGVYVKIEELRITIKTLHTLVEKLIKQRDAILNKEIEILIPVDLSNKSISACQVGFELAERLEALPRLLHTYTNAKSDINIVGTKRLDINSINHSRAEHTDRLETFVKHIQELQNSSELPKVEFEYALEEGLPEECILEKTKTMPRQIIVMATRTRHKRAEEMVGSVTAEVLDSCRVPLFTVPENYACPGIRNITRLIFFCHGDRHDHLAMKQFLALFDYPKVHITLLPVNERVSLKAKLYADKLAAEFKRIYPDSTFDTLILERESFRDEFKNFVEKEKIELLVVQNKKKNIFSRLINPGIAHVLLYERDMPMIILPV